MGKSDFFVIFDVFFGSPAVEERNSSGSDAFFAVPARSSRDHFFSGLRISGQPDIGGNYENHDFLDF